MVSLAELLQISHKTKTVKPYKLIFLQILLQLLLPILPHQIRQLSIPHQKHTQHVILLPYIILQQL